MQGRIYAGEDIYAGAAVEAQKADKTGTLVCVTAGQGWTDMQTGQLAGAQPLNSTPVSHCPTHPPTHLTDQPQCQHSACDQMYLHCNTMQCILFLATEYKCKI